VLCWSPTIWSPWRRRATGWSPGPHGSPGLIELRGQGIFRQEALAEAAIDVVVRLGPATEPVERLPPAGQVALAGVTLPAFDLDPFPASAVARLRLLAPGSASFEPAGSRPRQPIAASSSSPACPVPGARAA
jgi:hypothetical protein